MLKDELTVVTSRRSSSLTPHRSRMLPVRMLSLRDTARLNASRQHRELMIHAVANLSLRRANIIETILVISSVIVQVC